MSEPCAVSVIALVGAGGNLGRYVLFGLKNSPYNFEIRTLSRKLAPPKGSDSNHHVQVDFNNEEQLKESLKGCEFLINCMGTSGDYHGSKMALVHAAAAAGVYGYITSDFGVDYNAPSVHFDHPVWAEKKQHLEYSKSLGLRTLAICPGLFLEEPFGAFGPWHGFDHDSKSFIVAGTGKQRISVTSKLDIGAAVARVCHLVLSTEAKRNHSQIQPLSKKDYIRISGHAVTPYQVVDVANRNSETGDGKGGDQCENWKVQALTSEEQCQSFQSSMKVVAMDAEAESVLDHDGGFDPEVASQVAGRVFRAVGDGTLDFAENDNELLNPRQQYWKWTQLTNFEKDTKAKGLW
ncbi:hypothetical protein EDB81DRAFT_785732 [Dactylonectria macrodidyma]|uniref:NmrA-like domain-containing protein n=1 Tax=Dactylonectria macrodidyma TaxID=307937 RepID=A0A9P9FIY7_9HYPO|nr:hypothetical protein EDB81DRAFT_785732 [Dactylonectria macrodidyma]